MMRPRSRNGTPWPATSFRWHLSRMPQSVRGGGHQDDAADNNDPCDPKRISVDMCTAMSAIPSEGADRCVNRSVEHRVDGGGHECEWHRRPASPANEQCNHGRDAARRQSQVEREPRRRRGAVEPRAQLLHVAGPRRDILSSEPGAPCESQRCDGGSRPAGIVPLTRIPDLSRRLPPGPTHGVVLDEMGSYGPSNAISPARNTLNGWPGRMTMVGGMSSPRRAVSSETSPIFWPSAPAAT